MVKRRKVPLCPTCGGPCTGNTKDGFATLASNYEDEIVAWDRRMAFLFRELPFDIRHQWGGDAHEMVEGIDWAIANNAPSRRKVSPPAEQPESWERVATALENIWEELRLRNRARGVFPE